MSMDCMKISANTISYYQITRALNIQGTLNECQKY